MHKLNIILFEVYNMLQFLSFIDEDHSKSVIILKIFIQNVKNIFFA